MKKKKKYPSSAGTYRENKNFFKTIFNKNFKIINQKIQKNALCKNAKSLFSGNIAGEQGYGIFLPLQIYPVAL